MNFFKTSFFSGIGTAINLVTKLITNKIVAVYLSTEGMFLLGQLKDFLKVSHVISNLGTVNGTIKYTAQYHHDETQFKAILGTSFKIHFYFSVIVLFVLLMFNESLSYYLFKNTDYANFLIVLGFSIVSVSIQTLFLSILNGLGRVKVYVLINVISAILGAIIMVFLILNFDIKGALYAFAINQFLAFLITVIILLIYKPFQLTLLFSSFNLNQFKC